MVSTNRPTVESGPEKTVNQQRLEKRKAARVEAHRQRVNQDKILTEFQPDAVEIEETSVPGGARWTLYASIALICCTVAWSYWAKVDKIVTATGKLVTIEPAVVIQSFSASPIRSMEYKFGDFVSTGDILATLDPTFPEADLASLHAKQKTLQANIARLKAERNSVPFTIDGRENDIVMMMQYQAYTERNNEYQAKMNEFASENNKLVVQENNNRADIKQLSKDLQTYTSLEQKYIELQKKGSASPVDVLSRKIQRREADAKLRTTRSRSLELISEKDALDKRKIAFKAGWRAKVVTELIENHQELAEVEQQINKAKKMNEFVDVRVPPNEKYEEFFVFEVADRSPGSVTQAGEPLYKLIPVNAPMEVEIEVPGKDIGLIRIGSEVRVKLASFPYQKHGTMKGTIRAISEGTIEKKDELGNSTTMFRALVILDDAVKLENVNEHFRLMPGMATVAEIKVGRRRVIQYFLFPLIRYWDTSIREP